MSERSDGSCNDLRDGLDTTEAHLKTGEDNLQELPSKGEQALYSSLAEARKQAVSGKEQFLRQAELKIAETKVAIEDWKSSPS